MIPDLQFVSKYLIHISSVHVHVRSICVLDFFRDECSENAEEACSEFYVEVPRSEEFNSTAFEQFCG